MSVRSSKTPAQKRRNGALEKMEELTVGLRGSCRAPPKYVFQPSMVRVAYFCMINTDQKDSGT